MTPSFHLSSPAFDFRPGEAALADWLLTRVVRHVADICLVWYAPLAVLGSWRAVVWAFGVQAERHDHWGLDDAAVIAAHLFARSFTHFLARLGFAVAFQEARRAGRDGDLLRATRARLAVWPDSRF